MTQGVGSMPMNVVTSPDGKYALTTGAGYREAVCCVRLSDGQQTGRIDFEKSKKHKTNGLYYGLAFGPDGTLYAAQGANGSVAVIALDADGKLNLKREFATGVTDFPAGVAVDDAGHVFVSQNDPIHKEPLFGTPASVSVHDSATGKELGRYTFEDDYGLSNFPLAVAVNHAGTRAYVASERDSAVYVLDTSNLQHITLRTKLATGANPIALLLNKSQSTLYVANAHSDTVSIVDTAADKITGTVLLRPEVAKDLAGATPTGLALSPSGKMLYVTLGDMNAVAVVDLDEDDGPEVEGYIPTGWYPTAVAVADGKLLITNAKGDKSRVPHDFSSGKHVTSPLNLFEGTLWQVPIPHQHELQAATDQCLADARLTPAFLNGRNPLQAISLASKKIQHVIYIVKENRTYDQILGDLPQGNGDLDRNLFGRDVTPNLHALAERFILLDNFYDSGEVSGDGWTWSTQAQANEYTIRNVPYQYSERGRTFDYEGSNNGFPTGGFPAKGPDGQPLSQDPRFVNGAHGVPDVAASPGGHLWDLAIKQGLTYRNDGFFLSSSAKNRDKEIVIPDNFPAVKALQPGGHDLAGVTNIDFRRFDLDFPDSDGPSHYATTSGDEKYYWPLRSYGQYHEVSRVSAFKRELAEMIAKDPTGGAVPNLMTVRLGTDHTKGANPSEPTPRCMVADNDYAVGQLVDAVSHCPVWKSTVIVVLEDDAQNGPDHVDAHRSVCYMISPFMKRSSIDHSFQNTVSALHTIECLLNLPPMCQYDAAADVIHGWDETPSNAEPFTAILPTAEIMKERNPKTNKSAPVSPEQPGDQKPTAMEQGEQLRTTDDVVAASSKMDFTRADQVPADLLNEVIWKTVRGPTSDMPPTPHAVGNPEPKKDDDDD